MRRTAAAVALDVVGSAAVLVLLTLTWQVARVRRGAPLGDVTADLTGRALTPAVFGLAVASLAGAVAALAVRGPVRRVVGAVVTAAGVGAGVLALRGLAAASDARARDLVAQALAGRSGGGPVVALTGAVEVATRPVWPVLTAVAAALVVAAGLVWTLTPAGARGLGGRYEAPRAAAPAREASLWSALDHGEDPTAADAGPDDAR